MSTEVRDKYEVVIGLEVHAQLLTKTKAYSSDINEYGAAPNTNVSVITLGHPGTLPVMNEKTIEFAIRLGLAVNAHIAPSQFFARKNYFYPDLPKGYQITQDTTPICTGGSIFIKDESGKEKEIGLTRIHMEEDAGKSIHDIDRFEPCRNSAFGNRFRAGPEKQPGSLQLSDGSSEIGALPGYL
jgi:aspartyl-tRNA(Asn)/glutamyl-tRNA(Gln) amidotransferase subunit B